MYKNWKCPSAFFSPQKDIFLQLFYIPYILQQLILSFLLIFWTFVFLSSKSPCISCFIVKFQLPVPVFLFLTHHNYLFTFFTQCVQFLVPGFSFCEGICETLELQFHVVVFSICLLLFLKGFKKFIIHVLFYMKLHIRHSVKNKEWGKKSWDYEQKFRIMVWEN